MTSTAHGPFDSARDHARAVEADPDRFRSMMSGFPSGVAVVSAIDGSGAPHGLTCTSVCSVSLAPPALLVCLNNRSGTLSGLAASGLFAVNLLLAHGRRAAEVFAGPYPDRFSHVEWEATALHGLPALTRDAHAVAECRVSQTVPAGDHTVVIGAVEEVTRLPGDAPLLYGRRCFAAWPATEEPASL